MFSSWGGRQIPSPGFFHSPAARMDIYGTGDMVEPTSDAGERWDAEMVDRVGAIVEARLSGVLATSSWFDLTESQRRRLRPVIEGMSDRGMR